jgi:hypothetical protein
LPKLWSIPSAQPETIYSWRVCIQRYGLKQMEKDHFIRPFSEEQEGIRRVLIEVFRIGSLQADC